jgi:hypothetical protein
MSISSLSVAKFQFAWAREEGRDPREQTSLLRIAASQRRTLTASTYTRA